MGSKLSPARSDRDLVQIVDAALTDSAELLAPVEETSGKRGATIVAFALGG